MKTPLLPIRSGHVVDLDAMYALDCLCFAAPYRFSRRTMATFAQAPNTCTLVVETTDTLVGFLIVELRQDGGYLVTLDVHPGYRRQGIAGSLLYAAERRLIEAGASFLSLHVAEQNWEAILFYGKANYVFTGQVVNYYGRGLNAHIYRKKLSA